MTRGDREKAIEILRADSIASYSVEDILSARDMAIKALEQEPILDKIRAEIIEMTSNRGFLSCETSAIHEDINAVFDKYKAESEE